MYHDQGHIPLKTVGFVYDREKQEWKAVEGVNVTLGLPIIRASVDHGTGFGHAGNGGANAAGSTGAPAPKAVKPAGDGQGTVSGEKKRSRHRPRRRSGGSKPNGGTEA